MSEIIITVLVMVNCGLILALCICYYLIKQLANGAAVQAELWAHQVHFNITTNSKIKDMQYEVLKQTI